MAQDLVLILGDWGFELSDVQEVYQGSIHIFNGDQDLMEALGFQQCIKEVVSALDQFFLDNYVLLLNAGVYCMPLPISAKDLQLTECVLNDNCATASKSCSCSSCSRRRAFFIILLE